MKPGVAAPDQGHLHGMFTGKQKKPRVQAHDVSCILYPEGGRGGMPSEMYIRTEPKKKAMSSLCYKNVLHVLVT